MVNFVSVVTCFVIVIKMEIFVEVEYRLNKTTTKLASSAGIAFRLAGIIGCGQKSEQPR